MAKANIHRRETLEQVYPQDAFANDAAQNGGGANEFVRGVRILSAPDGAGEFDFERATRQIGEAASAAFLTPHRRGDRPVNAAGPENAGGNSPPTQTAATDPQKEYQAFLADIVTAARKFGFSPEESPGRNEPRLRGLRQ